MEEAPLNCRIGKRKYIRNKFGEICEVYIPEGTTITGVKWFSSTPSSMAEAMCKRQEFFSFYKRDELGRLWRQDNMGHFILINQT